ncbi:MAG: DUF4383 domain-containing protein [Actinomycetota bacterium]|nr:DUF4383 domain-containing protein [Actinomycetota bacterium]
MARAATTRTPAQTFALIIGVVYLLVGILGLFFNQSFTGGTAGDKELIFRINYLHDIIHLVLGAGWIFASRAHAMARSVNMVFGVVLLLVAILGFIDPGSLMHTLINSGGSSDPDNFLHLVTGALGVYFGSVGAELGQRAVTA